MYFGPSILHVCFFVSKCVYAKGSLGFQALVPGFFIRTTSNYSVASRMRPDSIPPARCGGSRAMHVSFGQYYSGIQPMDVDSVVQQNLKAASVKRFEDMVV